MSLRFAIRTEPRLTGAKLARVGLLVPLLAFALAGVPSCVYGQGAAPDRSQQGDRGRRSDSRRFRDRDQSPNEEPAREAKPEPRITPPSNGSLSFGVPRSEKPARGFGAGAKTGSTATEGDRRWAAAALKKYDTDRNGHLSEPELDASKIKKYDANNDGKVQIEELVAFSQGRAKYRQFSSLRGDGESLKSYRLLSEAEKLPEDLPGWFRQRDRDGDGQVAMHEWSRSWNSSTVRDFTSKDRNGDGLITADEALTSGR